MRRSEVLAAVRRLDQGAGEREERAAFSFGLDVATDRHGPWIDRLEVALGAIAAPAAGSHEQRVRGAWALLALLRRELQRVEAQAGTRGRRRRKASWRGLDLAGRAP